MKVLACNNFQKIKIKRMQSALPVHADHTENPERWKMYASLLTYFLVISLVLSKEGQCLRSLRCRDRVASIGLHMGGIYIK